MAADNSPPRIRPILATAAVAVITLVGLKFVFDSYYVTMFEEEEYRKVGSVQPVALLALHAAEQKSLANAPVPIERAMQFVAKGRGEPIPGIANGGIIIPEASTDESSLIGWAQAPHARPAPPPSASPAPSAAPLGSASATPASSSSSAPPATSASASTRGPASATSAPKPPPPAPPAAPSSSPPPPHS